MKFSTILFVVVLIACAEGQTIVGLEPNNPPEKKDGVAAVLDLKTGERLTGLLNRVTLDGVVFIVGGQPITLPLDTVNIIHFGKLEAPKAELSKQEPAKEEAAKLEPKPQAEPANTEAETYGSITKQQAYNIAVNCILGRLKAPSTARFSTVENASVSVEHERRPFFTKSKEEYVHVRLLVDAQNSFGAMMREPWSTSITTDGKRCLCISLRP